MEFLKGGEGVVIFPEGTYYNNRMGPGKSGMLRFIISRMSFPLIPTGVQYKKNRSRTTVRVSFGDPIYPDKSLPPDSVLHTVMQRIALLSGL